MNKLDRLLDRLEIKVDEWNESRKDKPSPQEYFHFVLRLIPLLIVLAIIIIWVLIIWLG